MKRKNKHLGYFNTRKQAAAAYDHAVHNHGLPTSQLNFPTMKHDLNIRNQKEKKKEKKRQKVYVVSDVRKKERMEDTTSKTLC